MCVSVHECVCVYVYAQEDCKCSQCIFLLPNLLQIDNTEDDKIFVEKRATVNCVEFQNTDTVQDDNCTLHGMRHIFACKCHCGAICIGRSC